MKKSSLLFIAATLSVVAFAQENKVHLKGQLIDMGSTNVTLSYDGAASLIGDSRDIHIETDKDGNFDTVFTLTEPAFYRISRNTIYLTPGDDMTVKITTTNTEAEFQGKGSVANQYMKYRLFPHGGSFLEAGSNIKKDFEATKVTIDSLAHLRRQSLGALTGVSSEFKSLENARVTADVLNSYIMYLSYSKNLSKAESKEEAKAMQTKFYKDLVPYVQPLFKEINQDKLLDVAVVRDVMNYAFEPQFADWIDPSTLSSRTQELYQTANYVSLLREEINTNVVDSVKNYLSSIQHKEFAVELENKLEQASRLLPGRPAFDVEMEDVNGKVRHLADLKGKILYVDFWATWCGPCCEESPYFESLSKEYKDKDVVFVPLSTDKSKKAWMSYLAAHKKELPQYNTVDPGIRSQWGIFFIPRFILIDKDFNILNAYAPRPSSDEIRSVLDAALN